jgi:hypothetical protein
VEAPASPSPPPSAPPEPAPADDRNEKTVAVTIDAGAAREASAEPAVDAAAAIVDAARGDGAEGDGGAPDAAADPQALLASSGAVQAEVIYVTVVINAVEIRKNPAGARLGELLRSIPEWYGFLHGTEELIDPVKDTDWILISGPALVDSSACAITLHYSVSDAVVDKAIQIVSSHYVHGGPYDAGVPGVRSWLAHADRAERVIERPRPHVLVIVPPRRAAAVAKQLAHAKDMRKNIMPGVATWIRVVDPHHALPAFIPEGVLEARLTVKPRDDDGADIALDGDCKDEATAMRAAEEVSRTIRRNNSFLIALATNGLLSRPEVEAEGKHVHVRLTATRDQIEATLGAVRPFLANAGAIPAPPSAAPSRERPGTTH